MTTKDPITLNAAQAAGVLGLAQSTLAKLRLSGDGPVYCKLGRRVVYRRADLEAWLEFACCARYLRRRRQIAEMPHCPTPERRGGSDSRRG